MKLTEIGWECVGWSYLAQNRDQWQFLVNMVMNFRVSQKARCFLNKRATISFSRRTLLQG